MGGSDRRTRGWKAPLGCTLAAAWLVAAGAAGCGGGGDAPAPSASTTTEAVRSLVSDAGYPGAVAVRVTADRVEVAAAGVLQVGGTAAQASHRFPAGSLTKAMTATLAAVLVQEGRIAWESRLVDVLPEVAAGARAEYRQVTLRDLLAHRGGVFAVTSADQLAQVPPLSGTPAQQRLEFTGWALSRVPAVTPLQQTEYSNGGYIAAGAMLERAGGAAYETLMQHKLFQPLGMTAVFGAPGEGGASEAWGHVRDGAGRWTPLDPAMPGVALPAAANPAGGVKLSAQDLGRFLQLHVKARSGITGLLITPASAVTLHTAVQDGYGLGWSDGFDLQHRPLGYYAGSDDTSYYALMALRRDAQGAAAVMVNGYGDAVEAEASTAVLRLLP